MERYEKIYIFMRIKKILKTLENSVKTGDLEI